AVAGLAAEIFQDGAGFEQRQLLSSRPVMIDDRRDLVTRADLQELRRELLALAEIERLQTMLQTRLFHRVAGLVAIVRRPEIEIDHAASRRVVGVCPHAIKQRAHWRPQGHYPRRPN